jgi:amidohydrolase
VTDDDALATAYASQRERVRALARAIHADPETAFEEQRAHDRCAALLEGAGFRLERGIAELPTAFRATLGSGGLVASLCVEYDALPGIGHGCGHNLIAGASLGAALALAGQLADLDVTLHVIGTPAEEHGGGKQLLIERGVFEGVHLSLMSHPTPHTDTYDVLGSGSQAVGRWRATFTGRGAHAAANPADGINANDAAVIAQVAAGLLRQRMRDGQRLALVPQQSGVTNIVPETAVIDLECRALTLPEFEELRRQLFACLEGGAVATGAALEITATEPLYEPLVQDEVLGAAWNAAMRRLGRPLDGSLGIMAASTDMGNVSQRVPALHPFVGITGAGGALHTREFTAHADSEEGYRLMDDAAVAMASVIRDVASTPRSRAAILARAAELAAAPAARSGS